MKQIAAMVLKPTIQILKWLNIIQYVVDILTCVLNASKSKAPEELDEI